jgi:hypothetical protein
MKSSIPYIGVEQEFLLKDTQRKIFFLSFLSFCVNKQSIENALLMQDIL